MPSVKAFLTLEDSLKHRLIAKWQDMSAPMVSRLANYIVNQNLDKLQDELRKLELGDIIKGERKFIRFHSMGSFIFGASNFTKKVGNTSIVRSGESHEIIEIAETNFISMIESAESRIRQLVGDSSEDLVRVVKSWEDTRTVGRLRLQELPFNLPEFLEFFGDDVELSNLSRNQLEAFSESYLGRVIGRAGESVINASSSAHTSRLASYAFLLEAALGGATEYVVSEELDSSTCPVCFLMNGKTFDVSDSLSRLDDLLREENPGNLSNSSPWPSQSRNSVSELRSLSNSALASRGLGFPPYHPNCRGILLPN